MVYIVSTILFIIFTIIFIISLLTIYFNNMYIIE